MVLSKTAKMTDEYSSVEIKPAIDGKDGNDKGELSLGRHGKARHEAIAKVYSYKALFSCKVGHQESHCKFTRQRYRKEQHLPNDFKIPLPTSLIGTWNLWLLFVR